jgi:RNA polymerase sigma-70 factor (ECF subfamily)
MNGSDGYDPEHLLRQAKAGDGQALGALLVSYRNYLKLLARLQMSRRMRTKADASDAVQEVLVLAQQGFPQFRGTTEAELLAWLRQVLASTLATFNRRYFGTQARQTDLERDLQRELDQVSSALDARLLVHSTPSQQAARRELGVLLSDSLARLPERYREVLILRHVEELAFADIAQRMGRTVASVKNLWARGLAKLRSDWEIHHAN